MNKQLSDELKSEIIAGINKIPLLDTLDIRLEKLEYGLCEMSIESDGSLDGIFVSLGGGILITIADAAACFAIQTEIGIEDTLATTDMNIRFLAPGLSKAIAVARIVKTGRTLCLSDVEIYDENRKLLAVSQVSYMRLKKKLDRQFKK